MKLSDAINQAKSIVVMTTVNEDQYTVEITPTTALRIVTDANAADSVIKENDNFYANESRHSQVAWYSRSHILYLGS
tara:strand:+ start:198 stop:428 length:231 start_codon:yes stop_codon:yes gene_type:complete